MKYTLKQSLYTKEMYDAGELPEIGMIVEFCNECCEVFTNPDKNMSIVIKHGYEWEVVDLTDIKPIDTRTDKQKTDQYLEKFLAEQDRNGIFAEWSRNLLKEIIAGKIPNIKYTGEK